MNHRVGKVKNVRTIKAFRGESLRIDLGKAFTGGIVTAWMKKGPNDATYRSFQIIDNRYLILSKSKASDYYDAESVLIEEIAGRWYFDVEFLQEGGVPGEDERTIYSGSILFINDITGSEGIEVTDPGSYFPEYTMSSPDIDGNISLLKNGVPVDNIIDLSIYTRLAELSDVALSGSYGDLMGTPPLIANTSDLINNGESGLSTYVENGELGVVAFSNDYNDLSNKPVVPSPITNTSELINDGEDGIIPFTTSDKVSDSRIVVKNKSQIINQTLVSDKIYVIDLPIVIGTGESVIVPSTGLTMEGHGFNISSITSSDPSHTIFTSPVGGSGDLILSHMSLTASGASSQVFDIEDIGGTSAIEIEFINFSGCTSLGRQRNYRQGTWTTVGVYGCSDGLQLSGTWNGYKVTNSNCFGFGSSGNLFKRDDTVGFETLFSNRLFLNINVDLPSGALISDVNDSNFSDAELFQVNSSIAKLNGVINEDNTELLIPNISANSEKALFVGNIGIYNSATERYVEDSNVATSYTINWLKDTFFLTMTADTTFTESGLPFSGKNSEETTLYLTGNFIPTFPPDWLINLVGAYKGDEINEIKVKFVKTGVYFVNINNSLVVYPAPDLSTTNPTSLLPNQAQLLTLNGSFFTPSTLVSIEGQTINSTDFVNSGQIDLSVTTGVAEGVFDITINNGTSVTFTGALAVILGDVFIPTGVDWSGISGLIDISEGSNARIVTEGSDGFATWEKDLDFSRDIQLRFRLTKSPIVATDSFTNSYSINFVDQTTGDAIGMRAAYASGGFYGVRRAINYAQVGSRLAVFSSGSDFIMQWDSASKVMTTFVNNVLIDTDTTSYTTNNLQKLRVNVRFNVDIENIKYVELL